MKQLILTAGLLSSLTIGRDAYAEGGSCPNGYYPINGSGVSGCAPIPGYNHRQSQLPSLPTPQWASRWGAIAIDGTVGSVGLVTGMPNRRQAEQLALEDCSSKGGKSCQLEVSYSNGCAAVVAGDKLHNSTDGATLADAISAGMRTCEKEDTNCRVYFTTCSPAQRVK